MNIQSVKQRFGVIGRSEQLDRALSTAVRVANTDLTVLISGESGVGKEVFSKIIHQLSSRKHNTFIAINTGAIPAGTINSELFGHEKGAFTGATSERKGYFESANGGTLFLDEIGEMPLDTQAYLLRILESGEYIRVGSSKVIKTDVRIIAATNIDLENQIKKGKFREDLFYRLNTVPIRVPALHERPGDIYMLFRKFAGDFADKYRSEVVQLDDNARKLLENYRWPGNVRELKNVVEQLSILSEESLITAPLLTDIIPNIVNRNLPSLATSESDASFMQEREILYKLLFDMKNDMHDLKSLVYELVRANDLNLPDIKRLENVGSRTHVPTPQTFVKDYATKESNREPNYEFQEEAYDQQKTPILIHSDNSYQVTEVVEENLSLEANEEELIKKALTKHKGRRKDAADELGISERTLYRKIKQYKI